MEYRIEKDSMGEIKVAKDCYWGAQTARAMENFLISGERLPVEFIKSIAIIKMAAAIANVQLGLLEQKKGDAIVKAALEIIEGRWDDQFPLDIFQTGSAT